MTVLVLGSKFDLTCDYVIAQLLELNYPYLRINSEDLPYLNIALDPANGKLVIQQDQDVIVLGPDQIRSILFRRPVFLRDYDPLERNTFERFQRQHWAVFLRNLMVFDQCKWVNHPAAVYYAEHKGVQLQQAKRVGFVTPRTCVTNDDALIPDSLLQDGKIVLKGIDTVLIREGTKEFFGFTHVIESANLKNENISSAPAVFQQLLEPKLDLRVTVVGSDIFAASIISNGLPIYGDWRAHKEKAEYIPYKLPDEIIQKCFDLVTELKLNFGAIDLALFEDEYYFLEINPTGEWAWLVDSAKLPIDKAFAKCLTKID